MRERAFLGLAAATVAAALPVMAAEATAVRVADPASEVGRWQAPEPWPVGGSHALVLATGKVLVFSPPPGGEHHDLVARVWNPKTGEFLDVSTEHHIHCSGHSFLADGSVLVAGGHTQERCPTQGRREITIFDPFTNTWVPMSPLRFPRYYPTTLTLGDGRVLILSGFGKNCSAIRKMEVFDPLKGSRLLHEPLQYLHLYPRVHLLPDGDIAYVGPLAGTSIFRSESETWERITDTLLGEKRLTGTSFGVPSEPFGVMTCGGFSALNRNPTATCERISFRTKKPRWSRAAPMRFPRGHANAVLLPDRTVLMVGGATDGYHDGPIRNAELYDPGTDTWRLAPAQRETRGHHSVAVLLPDGRVLSTSETEDHADGHGDGHGGGHGDDATSPPSAEIYKPPYLFRGRRPAIRKAPDIIRYRKAFALKAKQAHRIGSIVLVRPSAVTHSVNSSQRIVELEFEFLGGRQLTARAPKSSNLAPPGYYMMFVLNDRGVPSKARMVQLLPRG